MRFDPRVDIGEGADGAGNACRSRSRAGGGEPFAGAREFRIGDRELEPEGGGLGVDAVRAADGERVLVLLGAALERLHQALDVCDQQIGAARELDCEAGVEHVGRREARVHVARLGADDLGQVGQERDDIVLDLALDRIDARDVEFCAVALVPDFLGGLFGHQAELGHGVGGVCLDLEPDAEAGFRLPDFRRLGAAVARDHQAAARLEAARRARDARGIGVATAGAEDRGARDEHVGAGRGDERRGFRRDAAVDLEVDRTALPIMRFRALDLVEHRRDEGLAAEAGVDGHDEHPGRPRRARIRSRSRASTD